MSAAPLSAESGAFSSGQNATSVVAMSPTLSSAFSPPLVEGEQVSITLLRSPPLPIAKRVDVVPLTADDWEVLSLNADEVENNMLGQVRAARTGMVIAVHVGRQGRTVCRFRVEACDPATQGEASDDVNGGLARAVRLSTDTEVVIAPRTRKSITEELDAASEEKQQLDFSEDHLNRARTSRPAIQTPLSAQQYLRRSLFKVLPKGAYNDSEAAITLHKIDAELLALAFGDKTLQGRCAITKIPCPAAPQVFAEAQRSARQNDQSHRLTTLHTRSDPKAPTDADEQRSEADESTDVTDSSTNAPRATTSTTYAAVNESTATLARRSWPIRHIIVSDEVRKKLSLVDFDLVRFSAPSPYTKSTGASTPAPSQPSSPTADVKVEEEAETGIAGYDSVLLACRNTIENAFRMRRWRALRASMQSSAAPKQLSTVGAGLLLTGGPGSGKTSVARVVSEQLEQNSLISSIFVDCTAHAEERLTAMRGLFDQWLAAAVWHSPCLLILDNLDRIVPSDQEHVDSPRSAQVAEALMHRIREVSSQHAIFVMATAQSNLSINKACTSAHHVFGETVDLKAPTKEVRKEILSFFVRQRKHLQPHELNYATIAGQCEGYLPADIRDLVERTVHESAVRNAEARLQQTQSNSSAEADRTAVRSLTMDDFAKAQKGFTPLSLRDIKLTQSSTRWDDIGGLRETRQVLRETLEWPTKYAKVFAQCPLRLRSGLLLYGYPGCGKTLLAGAVARECGLNFISVKGPEILNKYIGASEKSVRDLFDRAQAAKPCVLFFDEFDSIAPKRGHDSTGVTDRVVNQLLTQMDGAEGLSGVYVLAATSRPDLIDSALLRPGRLDKSLLCDLPSEEDRLDILRVLCGSNRIQLDSDVDLVAWAKRTEGFSGADLQALVYNANLEAVHENLNDAEDAKQAAPKTNGDAAGKKVKYVSFGGSKANKTTTLSGAERQALQRRMELILDNVEARRSAKHGGRLDHAGVDDTSERELDGGNKQRAKVVVTDDQLHKCLRSTRQSVPPEEAKRLKAIYQQFIGDRSGQFPNGEASQEIGARQSLM
jgi:peroxin-1